MSKSEDTDSNWFDHEDTSIAGFLMILAGAVAFMEIITAEVLYPDYSTRQDISDLGSLSRRTQSSISPRRRSSTAPCC